MTIPNIIAEDVRSDHELLQDFLSGEKEAFAKFYERYEYTVRRYLCSKLGKFNASQIEDTVQDVFLVAIQNVRQLKDCDHVTTWLLKTAKNKQYNHKSHAMVCLKHKIAHKDKQKNQSSPDNKTIYDAISQDKIQRTCLKINKLDAYTRTILQSRADGESIDAISKAIHSSPQTTRSKINNLVQYLRSDDDACFPVSFLTTGGLQQDPPYRFFTDMPIPPKSPYLGATIQAGVPVLVQDSLCWSLSDMPIPCGVPGTNVSTPYRTDAPTTLQNSPRWLVKDLIQRVIAQPLAKKINMNFFPIEHEVVFLKIQSNSPECPYSISDLRYLGVIANIQTPRNCTHFNGICVTEFSQSVGRIGSGSILTAKVPMESSDITKIMAKVNEMIPEKGQRIVLNGTPLIRRKRIDRFEVKLTYKSMIVDLYKPKTESKSQTSGNIYEMGFPICKTRSMWDYNVHERLPLDCDEGGVNKDYLRNLNAAILNNLVGKIKNAIYTDLGYYQQ